LTAALRWSLWLVTEEWARATRDGDLDAMARLVASGTDINASDGHSQTALMNAARDGRIDVVAFLVENGAALDRTAKYHLTALMLAVVNGHADIVRMLAKGGADLSVRGTGAPGFSGKNALDLAVDLGRGDIVDLLRGEG
jgi:ankyrin repeat protein